MSARLRPPPDWLSVVSVYEALGVDAAMQSEVSLDVVVPPAAVVRVVGSVFMESQQTRKLADILTT
jgi:hypothetical protein